MFLAPARYGAMGLPEWVCSLRFTPGSLRTSRGQQVTLLLPVSGALKPTLIRSKLGVDGIFENGRVKIVIRGETLAPTRGAIHDK